MSTAIEIAVDCTDHLAFFCPVCQSMLVTTKVRTEKVVVETKPLKMDKCTWIHLTCREHGYQGWRKFYWTVNDCTGMKGKE